jgi:hypothetical protein
VAIHPEPWLAALWCRARSDITDVPNRCPSPTGGQRCARGGGPIVTRRTAASAVCLTCGEDALKQLARRLDVGVGRAPVGGEVAAEGGGEDGALELFDERGEALEAGLGSARLREDRIDLR